MKQSEWLELCAYAGAVWGRELTEAQKAAGFKLFAAFDASVVGTAISDVADTGAERLPAWPVLLKQARSIAEREIHFPQLPQGDTLSDAEHDAAMIRLRARETPEQRRRADRMTSETKHLAMRERIRIAGELLGGAYARIDAGSWDRVFEEHLAMAGTSR